MVTAPVRGGDSLPMSCSATCKESWISLVTYESKRDVMWLAADVSMAREHGHLSLLHRRLSCPKSYLKCSANHDVSRIRWLPCSSERWYRVGNESYPSWALRYHSHTFIVVEALSRSGLSTNQIGALELLQLPAERLILVHTCLAMTVIRCPARD
jgi:hypothetical protein